MSTASSTQSTDRLRSETKLNGEPTCKIDPWSSHGESGFGCDGNRCLRPPLMRLA
jgi:hypothetical protein